MALNDIWLYPCIIASHTEEMGKAKEYDQNMLHENFK